MGDQELLESNTTVSIPKWGAGKGIRYDVEDFVVSPPSSEDGFFHLRYGQRAKTRVSNYDRINQELSMTVEVKDGEHMISDVNLSGLDKELALPTIDVSPHGISPVNEISAITPETSSSQSTKPLFVFHLKDSKPDIKKESEKEKPSTAPVTSESDLGAPLSDDFLSTAEYKKVVISEVEKASGDLINSFEAPLIKRRESLRGELVDCQLLNKVQNLGIDIATPFTSPLTSPLPTPVGSPTAKRKISGVVMDQNVTHSYFYTKSFQTQNHGADAATPRGLSATTANLSQQMDNAAKAAAALEAAKNMAAVGKKRKPKPSKLREMNFWAPTSM